MTHEVKILPMYFQAVWDRKKTFEVRKNDRGYQPGDIIILKEWDGKKFTGSVVIKKFAIYLQTQLTVSRLDTASLVSKIFEEDNNNAVN